jgi:all-trans-retinol 13,14-reductase
MKDPKKKGLSPSTVRVGRRYRAKRLDGPYDAIVIGSGIGGLTCAALLSSLGKKVVVFEQHYTAGGFTHTYARNGYEWDVGVHYIGDMGAKHTMARRLFDFITDEQLDWAAMDDHYDRIWLGDESYDLVAGRKEFRDEMVKNFPEEEAAIDEYIKRLDQAAACMPMITLQRILPKPAAKAAGLWRKWKEPAWLNQTTRQVLESLTDNQKLIAVLTGQWGDNGLPPAESSFIIHALIARHYLYGGYYPVGGSSKMAETIIPVIQKSGGEVFTYAAVEEILTDGNKATGVRMADGEEVKAPLVISDAGVFNTFGKLVPESVTKKLGYDKALDSVQRSMSSLCLYIGIDDTAENLGLPKTNYWIYPSEEYETELKKFMDDPYEEIPLVYISFPSAKDPAFKDNYPGKATIEIVAPGPWEWFDDWADEPWGKRGERYDALKERFAQRLFKHLYKHFPQLEGRIDYYELATPLSTQYFCWYDRGEIYGLDHDPDRFRQEWLKPKTKIDGLWLTGQDVLTCGVVGAAMGGLMTAIAVSGGKGLKLGKQFFVG